MSNPRPPDPKQVAVALKYDRGEDKVPRVVATGRGAVAERILELAFAHGVKVREDADLAEILFYIYRANERQAAAPATSEHA